MDNSDFWVIISAPAFAATMIHRAAANPAPIIVRAPIRSGQADSGIIVVSPPNMIPMINSKSTIMKKAPKTLRRTPHIELFCSISADAFIMLPCIKHHAATTKVATATIAIGKEDSIVPNSLTA